MLTILGRLALGLGAVAAATGLSCSIGIAPNKLLAKICSELDKPDGLTLLGADEVPARIWPTRPTMNDSSDWWPRCVPR